MKLTVNGMTIEGKPEECLQFLRMQKQETMAEMQRKYFNSNPIDKQRFVVRQIQPKHKTFYME